MSAAEALALAALVVVAGVALGLAPAVVQARRDAQLRRLLEDAHDIAASLGRHPIAGGQPGVALVQSDAATAAACSACDWAEVARHSLDGPEAAYARLDGLGRLHLEVVHA